MLLLRGFLFILYAFFVFQPVQAMENTTVEKTTSNKGQLRRSANFRYLKPFEKEDGDYAKFLKSIKGFEYTANHDFKLLDDPFLALEEAAKKAETEIVSYQQPPGNYTDLNAGAPFAVRIFGPNEKNYDLPKAGWKIHIPALPHSAQKILSMVMAVIDNDIALANKPGDNNIYKHTFFKVIETIPFMRSTYYIIGNLQGDGRETQVGKFITIYPADNKHAHAIAKSIDNLFDWMKGGNLLSDKDFYPLAGEAQVGKTGWVYMRYGNMTSSFDLINYKKYLRAQPKEIEVIKKKKKSKAGEKAGEEVEISEISILETDRTLFVKDDRFHPWPDFMNNRNDEYWKDAKDPFRAKDKYKLPDLNLRWRPHPEAVYIYWHNRPKTWDHLQNEGVVYEPSKSRAEKLSDAAAGGI